jgi:hypothetical protein
MKTYIVSRELDGNDSFEVKGKTLEDALYDALLSLGYRISESQDTEGSQS